MSEATSLEDALARVDAAAPELFASDPTVRAVGLEARGDGRWGLVATRCGDVVRPFSAAPPPVTQAAGLPVRHQHSRRSPSQLTRIPMRLHAGSSVPERRPQRPLPWGAEVQNFDADDRAGVLAREGVFAGTLGCMVALPDGRTAMLSNNHVLADDNHGHVGRDRVLQCAATSYAPFHEVATLGPFVTVHAWSGAGVPPTGSSHWNLVDAATAPLCDGMGWQRGYLREHGLQAATGVGTPKLGDRVFKVGRTTRLTRGIVVEAGVNVGPLPYRDGSSYFRRVFAIVGTDGQPFAQPGDSGSAIVRTDGTLVGLLFAGTDDRAYACTAENVFQALGCGLA